MIILTNLLKKQVYGIGVRPCRVEKKQSIDGENNWFLPTVHNQKNQTDRKLKFSDQIPEFPKHLFHIW